MPSLIMSEAYRCFYKRAHELSTWTSPVIIIIIITITIIIIIIVTLWL
jgi:hypothetical protein